MEGRRELGTQGVGRGGNRQHKVVGGGSGWGGHQGRAPRDPESRDHRGCFQRNWSLNRIPQQWTGIWAWPKGLGSLSSPGGMAYYQADGGVAGGGQSQGGLCGCGRGQGPPVCLGY